MCSQNCSLLLPVVRIVRSPVLAANVAPKQTQAHLALGSESSGGWASWNLQGKRHFRGGQRQHKRQNTTCFVKAVAKTVGIFQQNSGNDAKAV